MSNSKATNHRSSKLRRLSLVVVVAAIATSLLAPVAKAEVWFSDGAYADSGVGCTVFSTGFADASGYRGVDYTSTYGIYEKTRVFYHSIRGYTVNQWTDWDKDWTLLARGHTIGDSYINLFPLSTITIQVMYGKWVGGKWETRTAYAKASNYEGNVVNLVSPYRFLNAPTSSTTCDMEPDNQLVIITPNA